MDAGGLQTIHGQQPRDVAPSARHRVCRRRSCSGQAATSGHSLGPSFQQDVTFAFQNVRGMRPAKDGSNAKIDELLHMVHMRNIHICAVAETWLTDNTNHTFYDYPGYTFMHVPAAASNNRRGIGIILSPAASHAHSQACKVATSKLPAPPLSHRSQPVNRARAWRLPMTHHGKPIHDCGLAMRTSLRLPSIRSPKPPNTTQPEFLILYHNPSLSIYFFLHIYIPLYSVYISVSIYYVYILFICISFLFYIRAYVSILLLSSKSCPSLAPSWFFTPRPPLSVCLRLSLSLPLSRLPKPSSCPAAPSMGGDTAYLGSPLSSCPIPLSPSRPSLLYNYRCS